MSSAFDVPTERPALVLKARFVKSGKTSSSGKLSFHRGDLVDVWQQTDRAGLWFGQLLATGECGLFPAACVSLLSDNDLRTTLPPPPPPPPPPPSLPLLDNATDETEVPPLPPSPGSAATQDDASTSLSRRHSRRRNHHRQPRRHRRRASAPSRSSAAIDAPVDASQIDELNALARAFAQDQYLLEDDEDDDDDDQHTDLSHSDKSDEIASRSDSSSPPPDPSDVNPARRVLAASMPIAPSADSTPSPPVRSVSASHASVGDAQRRARIVAEFLQTERSFVDALSVLIDLYRVPLSQTRPPVLSVADLSKIFDVVEKLLQCNTRFLRALESRVEPWHDDHCIGDCLLSLIGELDVYLQFVNMYDLASARITDLLASNARFAAFCTAAQSLERSKRLDLRAYMIVPIQRIPRYVMLLADLVRSTSLAHDDASALHEAERRMREFADAMNQRKRERDADEANRQLAARFDALEFRLADPGRVLVQQGAVTSSTGFDGPATGEQQRVLFLFSDILLCAAPLKGDRFHFVWKVSLGSCTVTTRALDNDASILVEVNEARWQPTPPFTVPTVRTFTYARAGDVLRGSRAARPKATDWATLVATQVAEQRKVYRPPAGKRGIYLERNVLSAGEWVLLSAGSTTRTLRDGEVLIAEGAPFAGLFVVLDGALEVERNVRGRSVSLGTCTAGTLVGELAFLSGDATCSCVARGGTVRVRRLGEAALNGVLEAQSDLAEHFFTLICVRIGNLTMRLALRDAIAESGVPAGGSGGGGGGGGAADDAVRRIEHLPRNAVRSATDLGRNDSARVKSIAEQMRLIDVGSEVVHVKSAPCTVRRKAFKAATELHLFDTMLAFTYKLFGLNQRVVAPWALVQHVEQAPTQISLHVTNERDGAVDRYVLVFDTAELTREVFSTIQSLMGGGGSGSRPTGKAPIADESSAELYVDLAPRDSSLLLNSADWRLVFESATSQEFRAGDVVLGEGEQYQRIYQIGDGTCSVRVGGRHVADMKAGDVFGELSFLLGGGASASIVAESETVTVIFVERVRLQRLFDANPQLAGKFYKFVALFMAKRLREREAKLLRTETENLSD